MGLHAVAGPAFCQQPRARPALCPGREPAARAAQGDGFEGTIPPAFYLTQDGEAQLQPPQGLELGFGTALEVSPWRATHLHPCSSSFAYATSSSTPKLP